MVCFFVFVRQGPYRLSSNECRLAALGKVVIGA